MTSSAATRSIAPVSMSPPANAAAAFIGPTVCDDDGPIPILNSSKTLIIAQASAVWLPKRPLEDTSSISLVAARRSPRVEPCREHSSRMGVA